MSPFLEILYKLSHLIDLKLYPDNNHACELVITDHISIQIETDPPQENLLLGCIICEIPPGAFREEVLKHALVENYTEYPLFGIFSYVEKYNALALCDSLPLKGLHEDYLLDYITVLAEKAEKWRASISNNQPGPNSLDYASGKKPPPFGMKT